MPAATAAVMAHEMGHNFGFEHDDEIFNATGKKCACDDPSKYCIMDSIIRSVQLSASNRTRPSTTYKRVIGTSAFAFL